LLINNVHHIFQLNVFLPILVQVINLKSEDCSSDFTLPLNHAVTEVKAQPLFHFFNDTCMVTFSTADKFANIVFEFSESDGFKSYINSHITSILMYADDTSSSNRVLVSFYFHITMLCNLCFIEN